MPSADTFVTVANDHETGDLRSWGSLEMLSITPGKGQATTDL